MLGKLIVLAVVALTVVVANPMEDMMFKKMNDCCPALSTAFKSETADKCKKNPCKMQCLYESLTTTTGNKTTVNLAAVTSALDAMTDSWNLTALTAAKSKCAAAVPVVKGKCSSGVRQVYGCVVRALIQTCQTPVEGKCGGVMKKEKASKMTTTTTTTTTKAAT